MAAEVAVAVRFGEEGAAIEIGVVDLEDNFSETEADTEEEEDEAVMVITMEETFVVEEEDEVAEEAAIYLLVPEVKFLKRLERPPNLQ